MKLNLFAFLMFVIFLTIPLAAQNGDALPDFYYAVFSVEFLSAVVAVIAFTKIIRNMLGGLKGWIALVVTALVAVVYSVISYIGYGLPFSLGVGVFAFLAAAGIFKASKLVGKAVNKIAPPAKKN